MVLCCWLLQWAICENALMDNYLEDYPTAYSKHNRVLGMILSFNLGHIDPLVLNFNEYVSMCEAGWDPTIVIFTTVPWSDTLQRYFKRKAFCYRTNASMPIIMRESDPSIGTSLAAEHRKYTAAEVANYDVFVYHEDDILFKYHHLVAYLFETKKLFDFKLARDFTIGFQRYNPFIPLPAL